jgi:hypothetical protein
VDGRRRSERDGRDPQAAAGAGQADRHPRQRPVADKVDLLIVGDGYTKAEMKKFEASAPPGRSPVRHLAVQGARQGLQCLGHRAADQRIGRVAPIDRRAHASPLGTRYDIFGSERYVLTTDNRALRELAQYAPYEFIEILVNNETYGGGGIFGQFSTAAADNDWANYLFVHEFGHHFAGLADEYYTSPVAYARRRAPRTVGAQRHARCTIRPSSNGRSL